MPSNLHNRVKKILSGLFGTAIKEEVNVKKLFPSYTVHNHHYDLVIPAYNLIIECHGRQHESIQTFGGISGAEGALRLHRQKHRDRMKEDIAIENNWGYVVIWYNDLPKDETKASKIVKEKVLAAFERI